MQTSFQSIAIILLREVLSVQRCDLKACCMEITLQDKTIYIACDTDSELYQWIDDVYNVAIFNPALSTSGYFYSDKCHS
jgi:hypothetical protein